MHRQPVVWQQLPSKLRRVPQSSSAVQVFVSRLPPPLVGASDSAATKQQQQQRRSLRDTSPFVSLAVEDEPLDVVKEEAIWDAMVEGNEGAKLALDEADGEAEAAAAGRADRAADDAAEVHVSVVVETTEPASAGSSSSTFRVPLSALSTDDATQLAADAIGDAQIVDALEASSVKKKRKMKMNKHKRQKARKKERFKNEGKN